MKKVLLSLAAAALALSASAQVSTRVVSVGPSAVQYAGAKKVAKIASNQRWAGLYSSDALGEYGIGIPNYPGDNKCAAYLSPTVMSGYVGKKIVGMRFGLCAALDNSRVFINSATGAINNVRIGDELFAKDVAAPNKGWNEVTLDQPITIEDATGFFVGFDYKQINTTSGGRYTNDCYPISMVGEGDTEDNKLWLYCNITSKQGGQGLGWYGFNGQNENLSIQLLVEGDFPDYNVAPSDFGSTTGAVNTDVNFTVSFFNNSKEAVRDLDYVVTVDGEAQAEQHVTLANAVAVGNRGDFDVKVACGSEVKNRDVTVKVTKVNGNANQAEKAEAKGTLIVISKVFKRGVVVEELTGTGCGWCPRGLIGMEKAAKNYPDNFVGIAMHQFNASDPMYTSNYANVGLSGAPSCVINRNGKTIDPYYGSKKSILDDMAAAVKEVPMVGVEVNGAWNQDSTTVTINASIDSYVSGNYEIAYVLIADSLTGAGSSWRQGNYYATQYTKQQLINSGEEDLSILGKGGDKGSSYIQWDFMDVLIGSSYRNTTNQAAPITLTANETTTASYEVAMPTKAALKNALKATGRKVAAIAIIIDKQTGQVVNAGKSYNITAATGIQGVTGNVKADAVEVARYNAAGQRIEAPVKGLNIVKMSDGRTMKVIVK